MLLIVAIFAAIAIFIHLLTLTRQNNGYSKCSIVLFQCLQFQQIDQLFLVSDVWKIGVQREVFQFVPDMRNEKRVQFQRLLFERLKSQQLFTHEHFNVPDVQIERSVLFVQFEIQFFVQILDDERQLPHLQKSDRRFILQHEQFASESDHEHKNDDRESV